MGTCGITVLDCQASFTFEEGNEYSFFLRNINDSGHKKTIFSANELNPIQAWTTFENQTKFFSDLSVLDDEKYNTSDSLNSDLATWASETVTLKNGVDSLIAFEDQGKDDTDQYVNGDWNDFIVTATVPKPATVLGDGVVAGAMTIPEPATVLGLGVVAGAMTISRRRKQDKAF